jgi:hypothetical protein
MYSSLLDDVNYAMSKIEERDAVVAELQAYQTLADLKHHLDQIQSHMDSITDYCSWSEVREALRDV